MRPINHYIISGDTIATELPFLTGVNHLWILLETNIMRSLIVCSANIANNATRCRFAYKFAYVRDGCIFIRGYNDVFKK